MNGLPLPRGIADHAGLIDVKAFTSGGGSTVPILLDAIETILDKRAEWGVDVINMSFGTNASTDGTDALSQLVDLAVSMGIVVVASAGNNGPNNQGLGTPAAATRALSVAAADGRDTHGRADETLAGFSSRGPRADDDDDDFIDELKPEVTAVGADPPFGVRAARSNTSDGVRALQGTSMAAPHVTGLAALIIESKPGINPQSVKDIIISTSESRGNPNQYGWDEGWGFGLVNAYDALTTTVETSLGFPSHPPDPIWLSPDILTDPFPPAVGEMTTITAMIENAGPNDAENVRINFGVHVFSVSVPTFFDIGTVLVDIPANTTQAVDFEWVPQHSGHQCLKAEIGYGADTSFEDNRAQRNLNVTQSPVDFQVRNLFSVTPQLIEFEVRTADPDSAWTITLTSPNIMLGADDGPATITALPKPPLGARHGDQETFHIEAKTACCSLGGVSILATMRDCNGNGIDDWEDLEGGFSTDVDGDGIPDACAGGGGGEEWPGAP